MKFRIFKTFAMLAVAGSVALGAPQKVEAGSNAGGIVGGAIVGGLVLCALTNCTNQRNQRRSSGGSAPHVNQTVLADQKALNYFGFNAGSPDGVTGKKTRGAISSYQAAMGYPVTGKLDDAQRANLTNAYAWGQTGRPAAYPGITGAELLRAYSSEMAGGNYCQETGRCPYTPPVTARAEPVQPAYAGNQGDVATLNQEPTLPSFGSLGGADKNRSVASFCQTVDLVSAANGGPVSDVASITDKEQALNEQFCAARDYAIASTEQMLSGSNNTDAQVAEKCGQVANFMKTYVDALPSEGADLLGNRARMAVRDSGFSQADVRSIGQICLGYGYRTDDASVVLASSLLLVGAESEPYSEVLGHQLREGIGVEANPDLARKWYDNAFAALDDGTTPAFLPAQSYQRVVVMKAALTPGGLGQGASASGGLPSFGLGNN
jgi:peptidoglycan hydrolase-like protein with peptidoglycan-binding domain